MFDVAFLFVFYLIFVYLLSDLVCFYPPFCRPKRADFFLPESAQNEQKPAAPARQSASSSVGLQTKNNRKSHPANCLLPHFSAFYLSSRFQSFIAPKNETDKKFYPENTLFPALPMSVFFVSLFLNADFFFGNRLFCYPKSSPVPKKYSRKLSHFTAFLLHFHSTMSDIIL